MELRYNDRIVEDSPLLTTFMAKILPSLSIMSNAISSLPHMAGAIHNISEDLTGIVCDGAKAGCAIKLNTAAGSAVQAALFSLHGVSVQDTDGIIGDSFEKTIQNVGSLSTEGMMEADRTILKIMQAKQAASEKKLTFGQQLANQEQKSYFIHHA